MPISVSCTNCSAALRTPDAAAGKKIKCPKCQTILSIPGANASAPVITKNAPAPVRSSPPERRDEEVERNGDDDRDQSEEPRNRPKKRKGKRKHKSGAAVMIGIAAGGAALLIGVVALVLYFALSKPTVAKNDFKQDLAKFQNPPESPPKQNDDDPPLKAVAQTPRTAATRAESQGKLKQIVMALHNYNAQMNSLPPAAGGGGNGLSWRVAILPFLEQNPLFNKFKMDEPWDSPQNKAALEQYPMPKVFAAPLWLENPDEEKKTYYQLVVGPKTAWPEPTSKPKIPGSYPDGTSSTILIIEGRRPVFWTAPEDVQFDGMKAPKVGGVYGGDFHGAMVDGSVQYFNRATLGDDLLKGLITPAGGENVSSALGS